LVPKIEMSNRFLHYRKLECIIADYIFWDDNKLDLEEWLANNTKKGSRTRTGMILNFSNEQEVLMFLLRWQGVTQFGRGADALLRRLGK
jgi:hypothetical protein